MCQSSFTTARSKRLLTVTVLFFLPKTSYFQKIKFQNSTIIIWLKVKTELSKHCMPASFLLCPVVLLKSSIMNHGPVLTMAKRVRRFQNFYLISKTGFPSTNVVKNFIPSMSSSTSIIQLFKNKSLIWKSSIKKKINIFFSQWLNGKQIIKS